MRLKLFLLSSFLLVFGLNLSQAQGCEDDPVPGATDSGIPKKSTMTVFGYLQPEYKHTFYSPSDESTFKFRRARFGMRGRVNSSFSYYFMVEASDFIGQDGNMFLMDAFVTYDKYKWAKVSVGSYKQPFSRELMTGCHSLKTIDRSIAVDQLVAPQRDMGIMLLGGDKSTQFTYMVAMMNGRGLGIKDNNNRKDVVTRLTYAPFEWLSLGGSFRYGYPNDIEDRTSYGVDLEAKQWNFTLSTEYIYDEGDYNRATGGGCGSEPLELGEERSGAYVMLYYNVNGEKVWEPVFKWEYFDQDNNLSSIGYQEMMTFGLNYYPTKNVRFQVNYQHKTEKGITIDNDALIAQFQVRF